MIASGLAGLGYEMVWTQMLAVALGHESVAVMAVLVAFFAGIALGAWLLDKPIRRSARPEYLYAVLELTIGGWALGLIILIPAFNRLVFAALGTEPALMWHWLVAFLGTFLLLLPATAAMGATLPAMERVVSRHTNNANAVSSLYAANTLGAMLGTVAGTFVLARLFGFTVTLILLALVNLVCALLVARAIPDTPMAMTSGRPKLRSDAFGRRRLMLALTLTGLLGLGYEVVAIRVLAQVLENTVFTFASLLAVYLLGTAIGAAIYQRVGATNERTFVIIITGLTLSSTLGICALSVSRPLHLWLVETLGDGMVPGIAGEWIVALVVFLPPTLFMGASFAHLAQRARDRLGVGCALALNTLGAALAPVIFGVVLTPAIGSKLSLVVIAAGYLLLLLPTMRSHRLPLAAGLAVVTLVGLSPLNLRVVTVPEGGQLLAFNEGRMANVAVVQDASTARFLKVNNQYTMGSTNSRFSDRRQAHIPLLMHPRPRNALFLGLGTGATFVAAAEHPELRATAVELLPELLPVLTHFGTSREDVEQHPNLNLVSADARRFVASSRELYDVIVADVFHPARDGAAALYTQEHFAAIRERLDKDGLFCQWLPLFQIDLTTLRSIVHTFVTTFPDAQMHLAHFSLGQPIIGLVGRRTPYRFEAGYLRKRRVEAALATELASVRLNNDFALLGGYLAGGNELAKFARGAALNTDDHPAVAWSAPHFLFATPEPAYIRLLALVDALNARPDGLLDTMQVDAATVQRFAAYWKARDEYLRIGVDVTPTNNTRRMLEQIGQPLMRLVEASPEFSPAYLPLVQMAVELSATDPLVSKALLQRLEMAAPDRSEATEARRRLFFP